MKKSLVTDGDWTTVAKARDVAAEAGERIATARRDFLKLFGYGAAGLAMGGLSVDKDGSPRFMAEAAAMPAPYSPYANAFQFADRLLYMNIGTTGSSPTRVIRDFADDYKDIARNPTAYFFGQQEMRNSIAPGFGCDPYELVLSFNTTDGLWRIVMGIPFEAGDEIITTNMEEDAGISAVDVLVDRFGVIKKTVDLPTNDAYSDREVLKRFKAQLTNKTKAVLFSSPIYLTGARLPAKKLCLGAARRGILSIVDGAHLPGMCAVNLHDMGCDFFSGSGHKWQCGPGQTGFLYIRNGYDPDYRIVERPTGDFAPFGAPSPTVEIGIPGYTNTAPLPTYYPTNTLIYGAAGILKNGERDPEHNIAAVLQLIGNGSRPSQQALTECCQLWDTWGREEIEDYVVALAQYLRSRIVEIWGPQSLSVPFDGESYPVPEVSRTGLTSFNPFSISRTRPGRPYHDYNADLTERQAEAQSGASSTAVATLRDDYQIVIRNNSVPHSLRSDPSANATLGTFSSPLRVSTHLFHSTSDVDRLIEALLEVVPPLAPPL